MKDFIISPIHQTYVNLYGSRQKKGSNDDQDGANHKKESGKGNSLVWNFGRTSLELYRGSGNISISESI